MKYLTFSGFIEVPDDFDFQNDEKIANWVNDYLFEAIGLCDFNSETGCSPEHNVAAHLLTEEQFAARYEDE